MRILYCESWSDLITSGHSGYIYSERIDPGHVLDVHSCFAYTADAENNDMIHIGIVNGGQKTKVMVKGLPTPELGISASKSVLIGEGDQVYAYFPNSDETDTIEIHVVGILYSLEEWRKMTE